MCEATSVGQVWSCRRQLAEHASCYAERGVKEYTDASRSRLASAMQRPSASQIQAGYILTFLGAGKAHSDQLVIHQLENLYYSNDSDLPSHYGLPPISYRVFRRLAR